MTLAMRAFRERLTAHEIYPTADRHPLATWSVLGFHHFERLVENGFACDSIVQDLHQAFGCG